MASFGLGSFGTGGLGEMLSSQVGDETDELRKKRLRDQQSLMGQMGGGDDSVFGRFDQFAQLVGGMGRGIRQRFGSFGGGGFMR